VLFESSVEFRVLDDNESGGGTGQNGEFQSLGLGSKNYLNDGEGGGGTGQNGELSDSRRS